MKKFILPLIFIFVVGIFIFAKMLNSNLKKKQKKKKFIRKHRACGYEWK